LPAIFNKPVGYVAGIVCVDVKNSGGGRTRIIETSELEVTETGIVFRLEVDDPVPDVKHELEFGKGALLNCVKDPIRVVDHWPGIRSIMFFYHRGCPTKSG
jgi:hypothetical protein